MGSCCPSDFATWRHFLSLWGQTSLHRPSGSSTLCSYKNVLMTTIGYWLSLVSFNFLFKNIFKWKNETCWNYFSNRGKEDKEEWWGDIIYLIYCKNFYKCHNILPSTKLKKKFVCVCMYLNAHKNALNMQWTYMDPSAIIFYHDCFTWEPCFFFLEYFKANHR
jgi:hypothetical protein